MILNEGGNARSLFSEEISADLVVAGGGMSGVCCAITAAREGLKVALIQDRPVLGGNASSEVRLWILGATSHMGNNNRWAREGGVIDEILVENTFRNPEGNALIFDTILLEKIVEEKNISLYLNTSIYEVEKENPDHIRSVKAFCSQNQTEYRFNAPYFCDASGDGIVGFLAGAAFRMGAESKEEFGELFAPSKQYGELLGHSIYFYSKDTGRPVNFIPPSFALNDITEIPRYKSFDLKLQGCKLWWIEYGGRLDTVKDTEKIKWELWKVVYGVWNYIKNSGEFPEAANYTLEWVGTIPGKRESRRFEGEYMVTQQDVVEQRTHEDSVSYGGWSIDLHPADGVFSELPGCNQWHSKGLFGIPYRTMYSKNISNLFITGRILSATHVAFGSTRVMATAAHNAQAVGMAAAIAKEKNIQPAALLGHISELQQRLIKVGQFIPGVKALFNDDLTQSATITTSSDFELRQLPENGDQFQLKIGMGQLLPVSAGSLPRLRFHADSNSKQQLRVDLVVCSRAGSFTPDTVLEERSLDLAEGKNCVELQFDHKFNQGGYAFIIFRKNDEVSLHLTSHRLTGVLSVFQDVNKAVSNTGEQTPPEGIGVDRFQFWTPKRRPAGLNMAFQFDEPVYKFRGEHIKSGYARPYDQPNAWVAALDDKQPRIELRWKKSVSIRNICLSFDTDLDHPMESVLMHHPENVMPFCVQSYRILDDTGKVIYTRSDNHQTRNLIELSGVLETESLVIELDHPSETIPAALFEIRCY